MGMMKALASIVLAAGCWIAPAAARDCGTLSAPVIDITSNRFYSDKNNSIVDPVLWEKRKAAMKPLEDFRAAMSRFASRAIAGSSDWSSCVAKGLRGWAEGGALLGQMNEIQAHFERKWALAAFSMAYLMVKAEIAAEDRAIIEPWLDRVASEVAKDYQRRKKTYNNHYYWLGFALGASAAATGHAGHWALAAETYREAMRHIEPDGSLPKETARAGMALHYHAFSLQPLLMLAELAARRGENWYGRESGAIHRLAAFVQEGFENPAKAAKLAGAEQKPLGRFQMGWMPFYERRFPGRLPIAARVAQSDIWFEMTGGNMSALARIWVR
jgi:poly(beta-D-mannuronate) lyase